MSNSEIITPTSNVKPAVKIIIKCEISEALISKSRLALSIHDSEVRRSTSKYALMRAFIVVLFSASNAWKIKHPSANASVYKNAYINKSFA